MQRAFDLIVERLNYLLNHFGEHCDEYGNDENGNCRARSCSDCVLKHAIEIVNEVASEYFKENYFNLDNTKLHDCPKCGEKATHRVNKKGSWACGCFKCGLFKSSYDHVKAIQAWEDYCGEYGGGWIPCSERLPEIEADVLLSLRSLDVYTGFRANTEGSFYVEGEGYVEFENVIAWQPLPEPYKAESEE